MHYFIFFKKKQETKRVDNAALRLYNKYLKIYFDEYNTVTDADKETIDKIYDIMNLFLREYDYGK